MSLPEPGKKHNAQMRRRKRQIEEAHLEGLQLQEKALNPLAVRFMAPEYREALYDAWEEEYHSEYATPDMKKLLRKLMRRLCPERLLYVEPEPEEKPDEVEAQPDDRRESWQQEYHHRPPPRPPASPSPFIDHVVCLHCEKFFYGQLIVRTTVCPLCGRGHLMPVGSWNMSNNAWYPFNPQGGAA